MKTKTQPKSTIFIVDGKKEAEYHGFGLNERFMLFLSTMGVNVKSHSLHLTGEDTNVTIDSVDVCITYRSASYYGRSAYSNEWKMRKVRKIQIMDYFKDYVIATVPINKEFNQDKLIAKIQKHVDAKLSRKKVIADREAKITDTLTTMRDSYFRNPSIHKHIRNIYIHEKKIIFNICDADGGGSISADIETGKFISFNPAGTKSMKYSEVLDWESQVEHTVKIVRLIANELNENPLDKDISTFLQENIDFIPTHS